jgi:hemerythrin-like domain-containing protein
MAKRAEAFSEYDKQDAEGILRIVCAYGDDFHQAKEESALFPIFAGVCDTSQQAAVRHMVFEHGQDRALMTGMAEAIARANPAQFAEYGQRLASILRNHIYKEDHILFETIANVLNSEDDARITAEFEDLDRDFGAQNIAQLLDQLRVLEWKYLRKIT